MKHKIVVLLLLLTPFWSFSQNVNLSSGIVFDGEPFLAINPDNSQHIVVAWMGWIDIANRFKIKTKTSFDAGNTWSQVVELDHTISTYSSADPCIAFNKEGDVYISYIDFTGTTPPVTGGVYLRKSSDGGLTWENPTEVINTSFDGTKWPIDRPWMVIDKSNSSNQGNIYISTFNLNRTNPSFNPYLSVSMDDGASFNTRFLDTVGWVAGNLNPFPLCSPAVSSSGVFHGVYPSFFFEQSIFFQNFLASSSNGGISLTHNKVSTFDQNNAPTDTLAKKGVLLLCNPANAEHLAFIHLSRIHGDLDVFLSESFDEGNNWTTPIRINDDPIANGKMQDLIWGDFDQDGDLIISWRDRRNGSNNTYKTETEIWAAFRDKDSVNFESNFQITNQTIVYDDVLENAGNDFMCIRLMDDTLSATWGDTRDGFLNIWFQRMDTEGTILSTNQISSNELDPILLYPNPTNSIVTIKSELIKSIEMFNLDGKRVYNSSFEKPIDTFTLNIESFHPGLYIIKVKTERGEITRNILKQ